MGNTGKKLKSIFNKKIDARIDSIDHALNCSQSKQNDNPLRICIFAIKLHWYADILCKTLRQLGYDCMVTRNVKQCKDADIVFLFLKARHMDNRKYDKFKQIKTRNYSKLVVLLQVEQLLNPKYLDGFEIEQQYVDAVVNSPYELFDFVKSATSKPVFNMPLGYHEDMTRYNNVRKPLAIDWDILKIEAQSPSRIIYSDALINNNIRHFNRVEYNLDKIGYYARNSKICLHVHSYGENTATAAWRIIGLFMANKGFVLSQRSSHPQLVDGKHIVYFDSPVEMIDKIRYYVDHQNEAREIAESAFRLISSEFLFKDIVANVMKEIEGLLEEKMKTPGGI